jgi:hypothetical protein
MSFALDVRDGRRGAKGRAITIGDQTSLAMNTNSTDVSSLKYVTGATEGQGC